MKNGLKFPKFIQSIRLKLSAPPYHIKLRNPPKRQYSSERVNRCYGSLKSAAVF
jgi:hypothetical protein